MTVLDWNQACCEACWVDREGEWEGPVSGPQTLASLRIPVMLKSEHRLEQCAFCGAPTIVGIYVRADPATVAYPRPKTD